MKTFRHFSPLQWEPNVSRSKKDTFSTNCKLFKWL